MDPVSSDALTTPWTPAIPDLRLADGLTIRELPPDEWGRLSQTEGPFSGMALPVSETCRILIVETPEGQIVAHWPAFDAVHLDGLWKHPDYRHRPALDKVLLGAMVTLLQLIGVRYAYAIIHNEDLQTSGRMAEACGFVDQGGRIYAGPIPGLDPRPEPRPEET